MKKLQLTILSFFAFTAIGFAQAQEEQERLEQQPPPVTQRQVENDAQTASEMRKADKQNAEKLKTQQKEDMKKNRQDAATAGQNNTATTTPRKTAKKVSTKPKQ